MSKNDNSIFLSNAASDAMLAGIDPNFKYIRVSSTLFLWAVVTVKKKTESLFL
jgi:hypothetical protein